MNRPMIAPIISPREIHKNAVDHGWWIEPRGIPELVALIHSEASEVLEGYRNRIPEGQHGCISEELADIIIRVFDMAEALKIDIIGAVERKHKINIARPYRHGNKVC